MRVQEALADPALKKWSSEAPSEKVDGDRRCDVRDPCHQEDRASGQPPRAREERPQGHGGICRYWRKDVFDRSQGTECEVDGRGRKAEDHVENVVEQSYVPPMVATA